MQLSIILPTLNEAQYLNKQLEALQVFRQQGHQLIVVDGGSVDDTLMIAQSVLAQDALKKNSLDHVLLAKKGRALQMNAGANVATGEVLVFLHADTQLPVDAMDLILKAFNERQRSGKFWGRFNVRLSGDKWSFRIIEMFINIRSRLTSVVTGDQAIFVEASLFKDAGGFLEIELMEDIALSKTLRKVSSPVCLKQAVITSSRRWQKRGVMATVFLMWTLRFLYFIGVSPKRLVKMYR